MSSRHHVVLIPGFFAFENLGDLRYFVGVRETLAQQFESLELEPEVHEVATLPTASIRHRAARVLEVIEEVSRPGDKVHLVGHSTGGLDARLAVAPTASLPTRYDSRDAYERVKSLVTISTPHHGTPLASLYGSAMGKPLLRLLAVATIYILRYGRLPLSVATKMGGLFARADDLIGLTNTIADQLYSQLLADFTDERRRSVIEFLDQISTDQSLVFQLTPAALDLFNATTADPSGIRYASILTRAPSPSLGSVLRHGYDVYAQSMHLVYTGLWLMAARSRERDLGQLDPEQRRVIEESYGALPGTRDNDGAVPTLSQVWGPVLRAVEADHLDVVGHFGAERMVEGIHADWLPSGSDFGEDAFQAVWHDVARFIAGSAHASEAAG